MAVVDYGAAIIEWALGTTTLLERTKQIMGITGTAEDAQVSLWLDLAGRDAERYCDNKLVAQEVTERYAFSKSPISLRYYPADTISSVLIDGVEYKDGWELFENDGLVYATSDRYGYSASDYFNQLTITYTAGYDPLPSDIAAVLAITALAYKEQTSSKGTVKKEVINGVGSIEYAIPETFSGSSGMLSATSTDVLDRYRRHHV